MKPVNRKLADEHHHESDEGIDAVFERMWGAAGKPAGGYAGAFDVSENTIKTWRRRGAVSTKFLRGFAEETGTTLDYLMYGRTSQEQDAVLDANERTLLEYYRAAPKALRDAALRVLLGGEASAAAPKQKIKGTGHQITSTGDIVNKGTRK